MKEIYTKLDSVDQSLSEWTVYPVISSFTGTARVIYGIAETFFGSAGFAFDIARLPINHTDDIYKSLEKRVVHLIAGEANILKGLLEIIPFINIGVALFYKLNDNNPLITREELSS